MIDPLRIVDDFHDAFYRGDTQAARRWLADDLSFTGPAASFTGADAYLKASAHVAHGVKGIEKHKVFVDGADVCVLYDLVLDHRVGRVPVAEWLHLEGDRIAQIRMILDTAPFTARGAPRPADTATDPVCRMQVDKASAPATRTHAGITYYFCNPGCAVAFEKAPESHLDRG